MAGNGSELTASFIVKGAAAKLDELMIQKGVRAETREAVVNSFEMLGEYIPYAIAQGKAPNDRKVLAEFLAMKGAKTAKYLGSEPVNCAAAIVEFLLSSRTAATTTGILPLTVLAYGLALLDLIEVGNSCEPAQQAFYEIFLKQSEVKLVPIRESVRMGLR